MRVSTIEKQLGIETFASETRGIGGVIRQTCEDFVVEEVLVDGSKAELEPTPPSEITGFGRYLICLMVKRNWNTLLATRRIAKQLGISERRVRIAGIKDKKAVSAQYISIENIKLEKLNRLRIRDINIYPLRYSPNMIFTHMAFGNMFHLTIRGVSHSTAVIQKRISNIRGELNTIEGVPNFFGHQRFGTVRPITHLVGKALAQDRLDEAALVFLANPSLHEHPESREAREKLLGTEDFKEAFRYFPGRLIYERLMLSHLSNRPKDFIGAFRKLPQRLRILFLQAYQSYLFNRFLSQRLLQGIPISEPQIGDYVVKTDIHGLPTDIYVKANLENLNTLSAAARKKEMYVAIPLIGFKQGLSEGVQGEIERSILEKEGMTQDSFHVSSMPEMSARGKLRAALMPIIDLGLEKPFKDELNLDKKRLVVSFSLHRGCYATVVLREFMKPQDVIKAGF